MNTDMKAVATFVAAGIWSDGYYDETEKEIISEVAQVYSFDKEELTAAVEAEINDMKQLSEDQVNENLQRLGAKLDEKEKGVLFECVLETILADSKLSRKEVAALMAIADALGMSEEMAVLLLVDMVKTEPEIEVEF